MNRRKFLQTMMAGGAVVAGELWIPGSKLISIPTGKVSRRGPTISNGEFTVAAPHRPEGYTLEEFYDYLRENIRRGDEPMPFKNPLSRPTLTGAPMNFVLVDDYSLTSGLEQLRGGSIYERHTGSWYSSFMSIGDTVAAAETVSVVHV